jgi:uncharacterized Zn-binding protein involved in type VI secretion
MGTPAAVLGDQIKAMCSIHSIPNPATGAPQPAGPLSFSAPISIGTVKTVLIGGKPAAVAGSSGLNSPPHVGLYPSGPYVAPADQIGRVVTGSDTVLIGGQKAATQSCRCTVCGEQPGTLAASAATVLIGGIPEMSSTTSLEEMI